MSQVNKGDYGPIREKKNYNGNQRTSRGSMHSNSTKSSNGGRRGTRNRMARRSESMSGSQISTGTTKALTIEVKKRGVSTKDPSEETIALFGAYGVTGQYFLKRAIEAGFKVNALVLPGMRMGDLSGNQNLQMVTGSFDEIEKIREVVKNATYVVCLMNDCDHENFPPPIGNRERNEDPSYDSFNLNFMHNLVPILEHCAKCRVLLYQASSVASDSKGNVPFFSNIIKKMSLRKSYRNAKDEQDKIIQYVTHATKTVSFNYVITRPSDNIKDKPSRKKLAASKSQPGPFPITSSDLADFTLSALKMQKVYNSCPYVVQDGL